MMNEIIVSFNEQVKKTKNPFFGTFIVVWLIRNWKLLLTLANLNLYPTIDEKIGALKDYFIDDSIIKGFLVTSLISLVVIIATYFLMNVARLIVNLYENKVTPWIHKVTAPSSIVLFERYQKMEQRVRRAEEKLDSEKKRRLDAEGEIDKLEAELKRITDEGAEYYEQQFARKIELEDTIDNSMTETDKDKFIEIYHTISRRGLILQTLAKKFESLGLLKYESEPNWEQNSKYAFYQITEDGEKYRRHLITTGQVKLQTDENPIGTANASELE